MSFHMISMSSITSIMNRSYKISLCNYMRVYTRAVMGVSRWQHLVVMMRHEPACLNLRAVILQEMLSLHVCVCVCVCVHKYIYMFLYNRTCSFYKQPSPQKQANTYAWITITLCHTPVFASSSFTTNSIYTEINMVDAFIAADARMMIHACKHARLYLRKPRRQCRALSDTTPSL